MVLLLIYSFTFNLILCSERLHRMFNLILIPQDQCYYGFDLSEHEANDNRSVIDCKKNTRCISITWFPCDNTALV